MGKITFAVNEYLEQALENVNQVINSLAHQEPPNLEKALEHLYWLQGYFEGEIK